MNAVDRAATVKIFCQHLEEVIERSGLSRSAFASAVGLDRSTLSQLLSDNSDRLPRTETIVAIAAVAQVSVDWLLGLSQQQQPGAELVPSVPSGAPLIERGAARPLDERLQSWHAEAAGYKIRYVPTTLPDLLKTEHVIRYEYQEQGEPDQQLEQSEQRLAYSRLPETDMEVCSSLQSVELFASGSGIWRGLNVAQRREQMARMIDLLDELYPTLRWFMFDGLQRFSVPYTIFGPQRAAVYLGNMYFVFDATEHIRALSKHFDELIRSARVQPTEARAYLSSLQTRYLA